MLVQVTLDTVEVVLALKGDGTVDRDHEEGLKQAVQEAAVGEPKAWRESSGQWGRICWMFPLWFMSSRHMTYCMRAMMAH